MKPLALLAALVATHIGALAQGQGRPASLDMDAQSTLLLKELRLEKARANVQALPLSEQQKQRLSGTGDLQLLQKVLSRQSSLSSSALARDAEARIFLNTVASEANDAAVGDYLERQGLAPGRMLEEAREGQTPDVLAKAVKGKLVAGQNGMAVLMRSDVLITRGESLYPGSVKPGQMPALPGLKEGERPGIWTAGLTYPGALGMKSGSEFKLQCTGTVIAKTWFLTAAHCLLDEATGKRLVNDDMGVFLPNQQGQHSFAGFSGRANRNMKRISIVDSTWLGGETGESFPSTHAGFSPLIRSGKDLALLKLNAKEVAALPIRIPEVRLYVNTPTVPPASMIGFGVSDKSYLVESDLAVGVRTEMPAAFAAGRPLFSYGTAVEQGGICGGDSGGGVFAGKVTGQESVVYIIAINSGLVGVKSRSDAKLCIASEQAHTSLVAADAKAFLCKHAPEACPGTP